MEARGLAEDARHATRQAREMIVGLRADAGEPLRVGTGGGDARRWRRSRAWRRPRGRGVGELHPGKGRELEWIVQRALANVRGTRARAASRPACARLGGRAALTVVGRGRGLRMPDELEKLGAGRHFGVGGMRERALLAGGDLSVESAPGEGCVLSVRVPTEIVPREVGPPERRRPADADGSVPGRSVPGYTWQ